MTTYPIPDVGKGALYGKQLPPIRLAQLGYEAGWQDAQTLIVAVAVCLAESQGYTHAIHHNPPGPHTPDGSFDRGPWQLNTIHEAITDEIAYDEVKSTAAAFKLWVARGSSFEDWNAYNKGVFLHDSYVARAARGVGNYLASTLLDLPTPDGAAAYTHHLKQPVLNFQFRLDEAESRVTNARKLLKWAIASKATVSAVQAELAAAQLAAKKAVPS